MSVILYAIVYVSKHFSRIQLAFCSTRRFLLSWSWSYMLFTLSIPNVIKYKKIVWRTIEINQKLCRQTHKLDFNIKKLMKKKCQTCPIEWYATGNSMSISKNLLFEKVCLLHSFICSNQIVLQSRTKLIKECINVITYPMN